MGKWEEYDVDDLKRTMVAASNLKDEIEDINPFDMTEEEAEGLVDARYHVHKLYKILFRLASKADKEYAAAVEAEAQRTAWTREELDVYMDTPLTDEDRERAGLPLAGE